VREFGVFVDFALPVEGGVTEMAFGLVHSSELAAWDQGAGMMTKGGGTDALDPTDLMRPWQHVKAKLMHVDFKKGRIFLSIRRADPNPLLETLDSLLAGTSSRPEGPTLKTLNPRHPMDVSTDLRPLIGDLEVAVKFAQEVAATEGVTRATLGARVHSRASSQDVEVYLAKADGASGLEGGFHATYKIVLRKGMDVQEVEVESSLERNAVRALAAETVRRLTM